MQDLTVGLIQTTLHWEQPQANRDRLADKLVDCASADLIVLPEMFTTGFSMNAAHYAESPTGPTMTWMADQAARHNAVITGSVMMSTDGGYVNRLVWMPPDGHYQHYDKRHLFRYANEHAYYQAGEDRLIVTLQGWRICPLICYDLRFPVYSRNRNDYDLLIYVADWPTSRRHHWQSLLTARAIENLSYVIGVNRVGNDGNGLHYNGDSSAINMAGETLLSVAEKEATRTVTLSANALTTWRKQFPFHLDSDAFEII